MTKPRREAAKLKELDALSRSDRAELRTLLKRLDQAQREQKQARVAFARFARRAGISAVARELGVSKQAVFARIGAAKLAKKTEAKPTTRS